MVLKCNLIKGLFIANLKDYNKQEATLEPSS
jgi:hypothetical protein